MSYINDRFLIDETKIRETPPVFLESKEKLVTFLNYCEEESIPDLKFINFYSLWKDLLNDAITFLKQNDEREYSSTGEKPTRDKIAFGIDSLYEYFEEFRSFEAMLYGSDVFYRDHIKHVFRVWLLGIWIINEFKKQDTKIFFDQKEVNSREEHFTISNAEIEAMWCIIALTHDLGYPLNKINKIKSKIDSMMKYFGGVRSEGFEIPSHYHFINDFILKFISSKLIAEHLQTQLQTKFYLKFSKSFEQFDHGIISCILLMKNLVYFLESDLDLQQRSLGTIEDARQFYIRREILRPIASHTCTDIYHLYYNSLSFILILSDELQTWGRPTFSELQGGRYLEHLTQVPEISSKILNIKQDITEAEGDSSGEKYIYHLFKKWHKYLRSALDAKRRLFDFELKITLRAKERPDVFYELKLNKNEINIFKNKNPVKLESIY